jgi:prepilin signal peptidase PulO-like enzyme (type II secretory pathway)
LLSPAGLVIAFYTTFLTGAAISIILIIIGKKKLRGGSIPFGPFLSLGVIVPLLFENQILQVILPLIGI